MKTTETSMEPMEESIRTIKKSIKTIEKIDENHGKHDEQYGEFMKTMQQSMNTMEIWRNRWTTWKNWCMEKLMNIMEQSMNTMEQLWKQWKRNDENDGIIAEKIDKSMNTMKKSRLRLPQFMKTIEIDEIHRKKQWKPTKNEGPQPADPPKKYPPKRIPKYIPHPYNVSKLGLDWGRKNLQQPWSSQVSSR